MRYFGEGLLALWYGERAAEFISDNARTVSLALAVAVLVVGVGWIWYNKPARANPARVDAGALSPL